VIFDSSDRSTLESALQKVDADWYIDFTPKVSNVPSGKSKLIFIDVKQGGTLLTNSELQAIASVKPGAIWYVGGESNLRTPVDTIIEDLRYYYTEIKIVDPTARITSPSMLNWEFTCIGCGGGFESGKSWMTTFVARYQDLYGTLPPWDIWAIDLYPLDWWNTPNTGFTSETIAKYAPALPPIEESIPALQVEGYRSFIDSLAGKSGQPIIITEIGVHWGWTELKFGVPGCGTAAPGGEYKPLVVRDYFENVFTWFEDHATAYNLERWFTFVTYADIDNCRDDGYAGMSLLTSPGPESQLSNLGRWYVERSSP